MDFSFLFFYMVPIMVGVIFLIVIGTLIVTAVRSVFQWHSNNQQPVLTVEVEVMTKRTNMSHHHNNSVHNDTTSTTYYATFQVESGDRMELPMSGKEYGQLAEGDRGKLTFQGTRYQGFERAETNAGR